MTRQSQMHEVLIRVEYKHIYDENSGAVPMLLYTPFVIICIWGMFDIMQYVQCMCEYIQIHTYIHHIHNYATFGIPWAHDEMNAKDGGEYVNEQNISIMA